MAIAAVWQWLLARLSGRPSVRERHEQLTEAARRKAEKAGTLFDAYPDQEHKPHLRLVIVGSGIWQPVDLDGYGVEEMDLRSPRWRRELGPRLERARQAALEQGRKARDLRSTR